MDEKDKAVAIRALQSDIDALADGLRMKIKVYKRRYALHFYNGAVGVYASINASRDGMESEAILVRGHDLHHLLQSLTAIFGDSDLEQLILM